MFGTSSGSTRRCLGRCLVRPEKLSSKPSKELGKLTTICCKICTIPEFTPPWVDQSWYSLEEYTKSALAGCQMCGSLAAAIKVHPSLRQLEISELRWRLHEDELSHSWVLMCSVPLRWRGYLNLELFTLPSKLAHYDLNQKSYLKVYRSAKTTS
jgi:hypothetical protein